MDFETFVEFAVKATCIFCGAEKAVGVEEYCEESGVVPERVKEEARGTLEAAGWQVISVPSQGGLPDVMGMACPSCKSRGVKAL